MSQLPGNITELIVALEGLGKRNLNEEYELFETCRGVFEKLKRLSDFDPSDLKKTIKVLKDLPLEIKELEIYKLDIETEKLESKALNKQDLKELLEDYEKAQNEKEKNEIRKEVYKRTGQKNVEQFIKTQKEIADKNSEKLSKLSEETREKAIGNIAKIKLTESEELVEIIEKASLDNNFSEKELKKELKKNNYDKRGIEKIVQKVQEVRAKKVRELSPEVKESIAVDLKEVQSKKSDELIKIIEKASLDNNFSEKELKKELKKKFKDPERIENIIQKVEEIQAIILVENQAEEIATSTYKKLIEENIPVDEKIKITIKEEIIKAWKEGDGLKIPEELSNVAQTEIIIGETKKRVDKFKNDNFKAIVSYRAIELNNEISQNLRQNGIENEGLIQQYVEVVNKLTNNVETMVAEENRSDIYNFVQSENPNKGPGEIERSIDEARFMAKNVTMAPKKFNKLIQKYNLLREKIGSDKLPKLKEVRVTEKMAKVFKESPKLLKLMNGAQQMVGVWEKVNAFPGSILSRIGVQKAGLKIVEKIGGQAATEFVKNSAAIIAKEGTEKGFGIILKSILGKGAVTAAGGEAAVGGTVAGLVSAFQALPVVGQIIAVVVVAAAAVLAVVKPIIDETKKILEKVLGTNLNKIKKFVAEDLGLGKFIGGVTQFLFDLSVFFIGIPKLFGLIKFSATLTPIFIAFFAGTFLYNMLMHQQISSIVPPADLSGCILKRGSGPGGLPEGEINCDINAPENEVPGLISKEKYFDVVNRWSSGKKYLDECYNDVVNRSLCAGINPLYSLWVWMHESGASNYSLGRIQDFGINDSSIENNFDAQIKVFLNLDPASACDLNDPKLRGPDGYWLAWASRYLTGQCDPDFKHPDSGQTGREYLESSNPENPGMKMTWAWIASIPVPKDIYVEKGGQNCEQTGTPFSLTGPTKEIVGDDGQIYICSTGSNGTPGTINIIPGKAGTGGPVTQCPFGSFSHRGTWAMDFGVPNGTPIYSTFAGVAYVGEGNGYGVYVDVHSNIGGDEFFIRFAHMPPGGNMVSNGQKVEAGQQIGESDNNGFSTGPHLHYEVVGANINWDNAGPYFGMTQEEFNRACR